MVYSLALVCVARLSYRNKTINYQLEAGNSSLLLKACSITTKNSQIKIIIALFKLLFGA